MKRSRFLVTSTLGLMALGFTSISSALTIGTAVTGNGSTAAVFGQPIHYTDQNSLATAANNAFDKIGIDTSFKAADTIGYYIPLGGSDCTFGSNGCGLHADKGRGGPKMTMWLNFENVAAGDSYLNLFFEDLDLKGANDPRGFFESVTVFDLNGNESTSFSNIGDQGVAGNANEQQIASVGLGDLAAGDYWLQLVFDASSSFYAKNTPEFLLAVIDGEGLVTPPASVPLPAGVWLMLSGLGMLATMGSKKKKAA